MRIPLTQIRSMQAKMPDHEKTALLAIALGVASVSAVYVAFISQTGPGGDGTNCGQTPAGDQIQDC